MIPLDIYFVKSTITASNDTSATNTQTGSDAQLRPDACWHLDQTSSSQASCLPLWRRADDDLFHIASSFISFIYFLFESFRSSCIAPWLFRVSSSYWCRTKLRHNSCHDFAKPKNNEKWKFFPINFQQFLHFITLHSPSQSQFDDIIPRNDAVFCQKVENI